MPLVGLGGIESGLDVVRFLLAGSSAVQVGTATFRRPGAMVEILDELSEYCRQTGVRELSRLTGVLEV